MAKLTGAVAPKKDVVAAAKKKVDDLKAKAALAKQKKADADAAAQAAATEADASDAEETAAEQEETEDEALPDDEETDAVDAPEEDVRPETPLTVVDPSMHLPDGVFDVPRADGDAPVSTLKVTDLHPVALDQQEEDEGAHDWVEPYPEKGVVTVRFTIETPIGRTWYRAGDVATIPAELAHSISKQITGVGK